MKLNKHLPATLAALNVLGLIGALAVPATSFAQAWPAKPIRLVIGFAPGGGVDINARLLAPKLSEIIGQSVIVENKPGAGTNIANDIVAKAAPDGYTMLMNTAAVAINMSLYKSVPFDTLRDFAAVSIFSTSPNVLVVSSAIPAKTVKEFIALARSQPGTLNYSSAGAGTTQHLSGELLKTLTKTYIVHSPYSGSAPSLTALVAGDVQMSFANIPAISQQVKAGKLRALALTGAKRSDMLPGVPTMKESGIDMNVDVWYGVLVPAKTSTEIVHKLADGIGKVAREPDMKKRLLDLGAEPLGNTPEEFSKILTAEVATWAKVVKASGASATD